MIKHEKIEDRHGMIQLLLRGRKIHEKTFDISAAGRKIIKRWESTYLESGHHEFSIKIIYNNQKAEK